MMAFERRTDQATLSAYERHYTEEIPAEADAARALLRDYSRIAPESIDGHIRNVVRVSLESAALNSQSFPLLTTIDSDKRAKLWAVQPFVCIGRFRFLSLSFTRDPRYQKTLARLTRTDSKETFIDVACCVGQVLRQLVVDGVDSARLYGTDLQSEFLELGYELFRDKERLKATMVAGDMLAEGRTVTDDDPLAIFDGKMDIIHAGAFFHLFPRETQVQAAIRMIKFFRLNEPNVFIWGRQMAADVAGDMVGSLRNTGDKRFLHTAASWQGLWDEAGLATGTTWRTEWNVIKDNELDTPRVNSVRSDGVGIRIARFGVYAA
jgi:hypothetical protein